MELYKQMILFSRAFKLIKPEKTNSNRNIESNIQNIYNESLEIPRPIWNQFFPNEQLI